VNSLDETQKAKHICSFLSGTATSDIKSFKHNLLAEFGLGKAKDEHFWNAVLRQATVSGFLTKDIESFGVIKITEAGRSYMVSPQDFPLLKEHDFSNTDDVDSIIQSNSKEAVFDEELYHMLLDLRKSISRDRNIPPFVIFQEPSLKDMCFQYPITKEELTNIQGVGNGKAERYGEPFIGLIADYVERNEIDRPQDITVRTLVNKSQLKVQLIQNIDRKLSLEDIAKSQGKSFEDLLLEIETVVSSGTRVNINYYINDVLDQDSQDEVFDYFNEAETDDIIEAYNEFDGLYTEEELRLMRIRYMSEVAN